MTDRGGITVREATLGDSDALAALRTRHAAEDGYPEPAHTGTFNSVFRGWLSGAFQSEGWIAFVAEDGDQVVGNVFVKIVDKVPWPHLVYGSWAYVTNVYVVPEARNGGIGSAIMTATIDWARKRSMEMLLVWPSAQSVPFYSRLGFVPSPEAMELPLHLEGPTQPI